MLLSSLLSNSKNPIQFEETKKAMFVENQTSLSWICGILLCSKALFANEKILYITN